MIIIDGTSEIEYAGKTKIAIGKFDGVHLGHRKLISEITKPAEGYKSLVFTFSYDSSLIYNKEIKKNEHKKRITAAAEKLGISDKLRRKAGRLSGGERQRVAIARAIVCDQPIILADEPTGSLDSENKENVMKILLELCRNEKRTLVVVTHDMTVAEQCGRIIEMRSGKMVE